VVFAAATEQHAASVVDAMVKDPSATFAAYVVAKGLLV
jgi:hypothetical protein